VVHQGDRLSSVARKLYVAHTGTSIALKGRRWPHEFLGRQDARCTGTTTNIRARPKLLEVLLPDSTSSNDSNGLGWVVVY